MQQYFKFNDYTAPMPDQDGGYTEATAATSTADSKRSMKGTLRNKVLFTTESYNMKWTDIAAKDVAAIREQVEGKASVNFFHFNTHNATWEPGEFYVANINVGHYNLTEGSETCSELSFQITGINPIK